MAEQERLEPVRSEEVEKVEKVEQTYDEPQDQAIDEKEVQNHVVPISQDPVSEPISSELRSVEPIPIPTTQVEFDVKEKSEITDKPGSGTKKSPESTLLYILNFLQHNDRLKKSNELMPSSGALDSNLAFTGYSLLFISEVLKRLDGPLAKLEYAIPILSALRVDHHHKASIVPFAARIRSLSNLISDIRIFNRLWGLLPLLQWAVDTVQQPPNDPVLRQIAYLQVIANLLYQPLENIAYLAMHKVIPLSDYAQTQLWLKSCYLWALHVILDFIRLYRSAALQRKEIQTKIRTGQKVDAEEYKAANVSWNKALIVNFSYLPLTIHWSLEQGCVSDLVVGFLGALAASVNVIPSWRKVF